MAAFQAMQAGDLKALQALLRRHPQLARERGANGNTLLNLAVSLAAKIDVAAGLAMVETVLAAGADVNEPNDRGWTALHQAAYSNQREIAAELIAHGADLELEGHGSGGTPLVMALFWGHREVADFLSQHSIAPGNLRVAAGLGRLDLLENCFLGGDGAHRRSLCRARILPSA